TVTWEATRYRLLCSASCSWNLVPSMIYLPPSDSSPWHRLHDGRARRETYPLRLSRASRPRPGRLIQNPSGTRESRKCSDQGWRVKTRRYRLCPTRGGSCNVLSDSEPLEQETHGYRRKSEPTARSKRVRISTVLQHPAHRLLRRPDQVQPIRG